MTKITFTGDIIIAPEQLQAITKNADASDEEFADYIKNITSVSVNGKSYAASGRGAVKVINEDGSLKTDATPFAEGDTFEIAVTSTGYPEVKFTYTKNAQEEYKYVYAAMTWAEYWAAEGVQAAGDSSSSSELDTRNEADAMVFQTEKAIEEVGDKLDANDKTAVEADLAALKDLIAKAPVDNMTDEQVAEIKAAKEKLMESAQKLFAKVYEQAQGAAGAQGAGPDMSGAAGGASQGSSEAGYGDDVVDADYKEV